jgi:hypothetical protein
MNIKRIFTLKVFLAMVIIAAVMICLVCLYLYLRPDSSLPAGTSPYAINMLVTPASTSTPLPATPTASPTQPGMEATSTPAPGEIAVGVYVQVRPGVDALNLREEPGLESKRLNLAFDSEVFHVTGGPEVADGYTWWHLTASYDISRAGWAAQDFLVAIPRP